MRFIHWYAGHCQQQDVAEAYWGQAPYVLVAIVIAAGVFALVGAIVGRSASP